MFHTTEPEGSRAGAEQMTKARLPCLKHPHPSHPRTETQTGCVDSFNVMLKRYRGVRGSKREASGLAEIANLLEAEATRCVKLEPPKWVVSVNQPGTQQTHTQSHIMEPGQVNKRRHYFVEG